MILVNSDGRDTFYDPSVVESGPAAALVDYDDFLQVLNQKDLSAIWVIAGEKSAYGGSTVGSGFGGRLHHTTIYRLDGDVFTPYLYKDRIHPTERQLEIFFGDDPVPPGIATRTVVSET